MDVLTLFLAILIGLAGGLLGSIVGSFGLISIPCLLLLGVPPVTAIATSRFGGLGMFITSGYQYAKNKRVDWKLAPRVFLVYFITSIAGVLILLQASTAITTQIVGIIVAVLFIILFTHPGLGTIKHRPTHPVISFALLAIAGLWGGFFGGGYIFFGGVIIAGFFGLKFINMMGTSLIASWGVTIPTLIILGSAGAIRYDLGFALMLGFFIGGCIGPSLAIHQGNKWVRLVFMLFMVLTSIKLIFF